MLENNKLYKSKGAMNVWHTDGKIDKNLPDGEVVYLVSLIESKHFHQEVVRSYKMLSRFGTRLTSFINERFENIFFEEI